MFTPNLDMIQLVVTKFSNACNERWISNSSKELSLRKPFINRIEAALPQTARWTYKLSTEDMYTQQDPKNGLAGGSLSQTQVRVSKTPSSLLSSVYDCIGDNFQVLMPGRCTRFATGVASYILRSRSSRKRSRIWTRTEIYVILNTPPRLDRYWHL